MEQRPDKTKSTPARIAVLMKLFNGNAIEREQIISMQRPELQEILRNQVKAKRNADHLLELLVLDMRQASTEMHTDPKNQFRRRTAVRTAAAALDGIIYCLKQTALVTGQMNGYSFEGDDLFFLSEGAQEKDAGKRPRLPGFRDNLKQTFKLFSKISGMSCPTDFNNLGFESLCKTYELRHRLMHPKSFMTYCVNDEQKETAAEGVYWLNFEVKRLLDSCGAG